VVNRSLIGDQDANPFKPAKPIRDGLVGVGISGKYPTLSFNAATTQQERMSIAISLTRLNRTISTKQATSFVHNEINLIPHQLKLKGKTGWDSSIPIVAPSNHESGSWKAPEDDLHRTVNPCSAFFMCPNCKSLETCSLKTFQYYDLDVKHKCAFCNKHQPVRNWKCKCDTRWHLCNEHRYSVRSIHHSSNITANGQTLTVDTVPSKKRKWTNHSETYEEIHRAAERRMERNVQQRTKIDIGVATFSLGNAVHTKINANFFSQNLKQRFMGVGLGV
jgi:hypothetical protein